MIPINQPVYWNVIRVLNTAQVVVPNISGIFTPKIGEDEPILTSIFFKGVKAPTQFFSGTF